MGQDAEKEGEETDAEGGVTVLAAPLAIELGAAEVVEEAPLGHAGVVMKNLVFLHLDGDLGEHGDEGGDGAAEGVDGEVWVGQDVSEREAVGALEGAFKERPGDFKADEVVIGVRGEAVFGDLGDVEAKFGADVRFGAVFVGDSGAVFLAEFGEVESDGLIDGGVACGICRVVGEGSEGEGVFVEGVSFREHVEDEVSGAHVVDEIGEEVGAEGVVADVLDERAAVGVGVGFAEVCIRRVGEAGLQQRTELVAPEEVNDLLMGEDGVGVSRTCRQDEDREQQKRGERTQKQASGPRLETGEQGAGLDAQAQFS